MKLQKNIKNRIKNKVKKIDVNLITDKPVIASFDEVFHGIIKQLSQDNNRFYIEHDRKTDSFTVRKDKKQTEKEQIVTSIQAADNKIKRSKSKNEISKLRKLKKKSNRTTGKSWRIRINK